MTACAYIGHTLWARSPRSPWSALHRRLALIARDRVRVIFNDNHVIFTPQPLLDQLPSVQIVVFPQSSGLFRVKLFPSAGTQTWSVPQVTATAAAAQPEPVAAGSSSHAHDDTTKSATTKPPSGTVVGTAPGANPAGN